MSEVIGAIMLCVLFITCSFIIYAGLIIVEKHTINKSKHSTAIHHQIRNQKGE